MHVTMSPTTCSSAMLSRKPYMISVELFCRTEYNESEYSENILNSYLQFDVAEGSGNVDFNDALLSFKFVYAAVRRSFTIISK